MHPYVYVYADVHVHVIRAFLIDEASDGDKTTLVWSTLCNMSFFITTVNGLSYKLELTLCEVSMCVTIGGDGGTNDCHVGPAGKAMWLLFLCRCASAFHPQCAPVPIIGQSQAEDREIQKGHHVAMQQTWMFTYNQSVFRGSTKFYINCKL